MTDAESDGFGVESVGFGVECVLEGAGALTTTIQEYTSHE
jgi:hypothetical protein